MELFGSFILKLKGEFKIKRNSGFHMVKGAKLEVTPALSSLPVSLSGG